MRKFATGIAAVGLALVAATPAFANRQGGPDTQNPVAHEGAPASGALVQVWGGREQHLQPGVLADAVTGTSSDEVASYTVGRLTYRVVKLHEPATGTQFAKDDYVVFVNG